MSISLTCQCGQAFRANDDLAGKRIKCPKCGAPLTVPVTEDGDGDEFSAAGGVSAGLLDDLDDLLGGDAVDLTAGLPDDMPAGSGLPGAQLPGAGFQAPGASFPQAAFGQGAAGASATRSSSSPSESNKTFLLALCGLGALGLFAIGAIVWITLSGEDQPIVVENPPVVADKDEQPKAKPPAAELKVTVAGPVTVHPGGSAMIEFQVDRGGYAGPIEVVIDRVPLGFAVSPKAISAGESVGAVEVKVSSQLGDEQQTVPIEIKLTAGESETTHSVDVVVAKLGPPVFRTVGGLVLQPGSSAEATLSIDRKGNTGALPLQVKSSPSITGKVAAIEAEQSETTLTISVAENAPVGKQTCSVVGTARGGPFQVDVPIAIIAQPLQVKALQVVTLKPGEQKTVQVSVTRRGYAGPVSLAVTNLPRGVTVPAAELKASESTVTLTVSAAEDAAEHVRSARVEATGGNFRGDDYVVVRVRREEGGILPKEIADDPELSRLMRRGGFGGRLTTKTKQALMDIYGGTPESEKAVLAGLAWLAAHQQSDGRWPLKDYHNGIEGCTCRTEFEAEVTDSNTAGTAFGVLPFLGAGIAHNRAPEHPPELAGYQSVVQKAIQYLVTNQHVSRDDKSGRLDNNMYAHAIGTMALCEAYGLSGDDRLKVPAQLAIKYLIASQHQQGGWRYSPNTPGDLSVTGWIFLAIRNGQLSGLSIRDTSLVRAKRFIDSCAAGPEGTKNSRYSYTPGADMKLTMSAAGLLTRQYLGWRRETPDLLAGANYLMQNKPPLSGVRLGSIYYQYYATQVLHHLGGEDFDLWNHLMREHLLRSQKQSGHEAGSWDPNGTDYGTRGGRLYATSMALMTLEVYYRHLPIYGPALRKTN